MTYDAQRIAIQNHFETEWSGTYPDVPIAFDNVKLPRPDNGYVHLKILNGASMLKGLGLDKLYRYSGVISVDIYYPEKKAIKQVDLYADSIDDIFRGQQIGDVVCRAATRNDLGTWQNYWRTNISVPFFRNKISAT